MSAGTAQFAASSTPGNATRAAVEALFRHRTVFMASVGFVLLVTVLVTVLTPRTYESEMNILVRNARPDYLISPERSNGQIQQRDVTEERINSEMDVLRSKDVADAVVDPEWSAKPIAERTEAQIKDHEKAVLAFTRHLTVEALRKSNVIRVAYVAGSPHQATDTVDRLLKAFLAKQREIERSTGASNFFASEAERYKKELDTAQEELAGYQQNNQIVSLTDKENTLQAQITALEDAIRSTQVQLTEASERVASDKHQLAMLPQRLPTQQRSVYNMQAVEQLTALLTGYQNKRTELLTRYQPTDRLIAEVDQQIATTSAALANARTNNGQESTTDVNPVYQQVKGVLAISTTDQAALRGRLADLTAQHDRLRQQLVNVEGSTVDYTTLQTRVAELQSNYQLYSQKKNEAQIADAMDQQQLVNVAVAERPTFSGKPYRPQVLLNLALGLFTALFLGLCAVFFAELGRDTIAAPCELEAISAVPVLATVPFIAEAFPAFSSGGRPPRSPARRGGGGPAPVTPTGGTANNASPEQEQPWTTRVEPEFAMQSGPSNTEEERIMDTIVKEDARRPSRANLRTFEQLAVPQGAVSGSRPISPFGEPRPEPVKAPEVIAKPEPEPVPVAAAVAAMPTARAEPAPEPAPIPLEALDPSHRVPLRALNETLRSRLSPSQRAQQRRQAPQRDRDGRLAYVTYTVDPRS